MCIHMHAIIISEKMRAECEGNRGYIGEFGGKREKGEIFYLY